MSISCKRRYFTEFRNIRISVQNNVLNTEKFKRVYYGFASGSRLTANQNGCKINKFFGVREKCINFANESGWRNAIKREPGANPGQSRCGESL